MAQLQSTSITGSLIVTGGITGSISGSIVAPGSNTQLIFNNSGVLGASSNLTWNGSALTVTGNNSTFYNSGATSTTFVIGGAANSQYSVLVLESDSGNSQMWKGGSGASSWGGALATNIYNSNGPIAFHPNNTANAMYISTGGNVGIGTTSPLNKLVVTSDATYNSENTYAIAAAAASNSAYKTIIGFDYTNDVGVIAAVRTAVSWKNISIPQGNLGIGTLSPEQKLHVEGTIQLGNTENLAWAYDNGFYYNYITNFYDNSTGMTFRAGSWTSSNNVDFSFQTYYGGSWSTKLAIKGDGNVGIGTTSPSTALTVARAASTAPVLTLLTTDSTSNGFISWKDSSGVQNAAIGTNYGVSDTGAIEFISGSVTNMILRSNGNLLVGTTTSTYATSNRGVIQVNGNSTAIFGLTTGGTDSGYLYHTGTDMLVWNTKAGYIDIGTNNTTRVRVTSAGDVGIGTTSPSGKLNVAAGGGDGSAILRISGTASDIFNWASSTMYPNLTSGETVIHQIGKAESQYNSGHYGYRHTGDNSSSNMLTMGMFQNDYLVNILGNGNVGIGTTSPASLLHINGSGNTFTRYTNTSNSGHYIDIGANGAGESFVYGYGAYPLLFGTNGSERMRITSGGNIGIGTTSPSAKLHVVGNQSILSNYGVGSFQVYNYEISTGTSTSDNQTFSLYLGRFGNGYHKLIFWGSGYGTDTGASIEMTTDWGSSVAPKITTSTGLSIGAATFTIHYVRVDYGSYDLFIKYTAGMPTGYANTINYDIISNTGTGYTQFTYASGVTVPTLNSSNLVASITAFDYDTGRVGIGVTSPSYKLEVDGTFGIGGDATFNGTNTYINSSYIYVGNNDYDLVSISGNTMYFPGDGKVGIGTTTPGAKLDVNGTTYLASQVLINGTTNSSTTYMYDSYADGNSSYFQAPPALIRLDSAASGSIDQAPVALFIHNENGSNNTWTKLSLGSREASGAGNSVSIAGIAAQKTSGTANAWASGDLYLWTKNGGTQVVNMVLKPLGYVGIGFNNPDQPLAFADSLGTKIQFNGNNNNGYQIGLASGVAGGDAMFKFTAGETGAGEFGFYNTSNLRMLITSTGNIGINTTAPQKILDAVVSANDFATVGAATSMGIGQWAGIHFGYRENNTLYRKSAIVFERTDLTSNNAQGKVHILNGPQAGAGSATLADAKLTIAENGNVGIGTTSPSQLLHVSGGNALIRNAYIGVISTYGASYASFSHISRSGADDYSFLSGDVGDTYVNANNGYSIHFRQANADKMVIVSSGNVGIGTTTPEAKLQVSGSISGSSINFGQDTLNYYDVEDAWVPEIDTSNNDMAGINYDMQEGTYTRIGDVVHAWFYISVNSIATVGTGTAIIKTLPFTSGTQVTWFSSVITTDATLITVGNNGTQLKGHVAGASTNITLNLDDSGGNGFGYRSDAGWEASGGLISGYVVYKAQ